MKMNNIHIEETAEKFNHNKSDSFAHRLEADLGLCPDHLDSDYGTGVRPPVDPKFDWSNPSGEPY